MGGDGGPGGVAMPVPVPEQRGDGDDRMKHGGWGLLLFGFVAFLLPRFGLVLARRNVAMDPDVQTMLGLLCMILGTAFLVLSYAAGMDGSEGLGKLIYMGGMGLFIASAVLGGAVGMNRKKAANAGAAFAPFGGPRNPADFVPRRRRPGPGPEPWPRPPPPAMPAMPAMPGANADAGRVAITGGRA